MLRLQSDVQRWLATVSHTLFQGLPLMVRGV